MRFALMIEPQQGMSYGDQVAVAKRAEANGFDALFRSDHYASFPGPAGMPTTDAWTVLAGLARETERIGLGALVSPVTFRHLGNFAKVVTTVDEMSGGRVEVGVGAGWNDLEHRQYGLPFPPINERADLLEDQLAILHGLWGEPDGWSFEGHAVTVEDALFRPRPVDVPGRPVGPNGAARPRIITGGQGSPRGLRIAARWADEFNLSSTAPGKARDEVREARRRVPGDRARSGVDLPLRDGRRAHRAGPRTRSGRARRACSPPSARTPVATTGSRSAGSAGSSGRPTRRGRWSAGSATRACSGSCSRTSCRGTSTTSTSWARRWSARSRPAADRPGASRPRISPRRRPRRPRSAGRRGGSGPGPCRARGRPLGQELERRRGPEQRGDRCRQAGRLRDEEPSGGGQVAREGRIEVGREGSPRRGCRRRGPRGGPPGSGRTLAAVVAIGQDQHEGRLGTGRRQVAVQERLEVAERRRQPGGLLDLERQLAAGRAIGTGRDRR